MRIEPVAISIVVFACVFGGAILGTLLHAKLPEHHRDGDSRDVIKLVLGLIATIAALVLSLLIASAHTTYDTQEAEVRQIGANVGLLDRILVQYGPETKEARVLLRQLVARDVARIWSDTDTWPTHLPSLDTHAHDADLFALVAGLSPKTEAQRFGQNRSLQLMADISMTRRLMSEQAGGSLPWPLFVVLVSWLIVLFVGFGLFARLNLTVFAAYLIGALSAAGAIMLILDMNTPYTGLMQITSSPLREALLPMEK